MMNLIRPMYSYTSMTLHDVLKENPDLLDDMNMGNADRTKSFKDMFKAVYDTKSIGAETVELFKLWINNRFQEWKDYYNQMLTIYEKELDYDKGIITKRNHTDEGSSSGENGSLAETQNIDLPNRSVSGEYVTDKVKNSSGGSYSDEYGKEINETYEGGVNVVEQREKAMKFIKNIYRDFAMKFSDCFACIYG